MSIDNSPNLTKRSGTYATRPIYGNHTQSAIGSAMSNYQSRYSQHFRQPSVSTSSAGSQQSPALVARINEKKQELGNLIALRDLSAGLAKQMEHLEEKLATLADGTEGRSFWLILVSKEQFELMNTE